jgi:hypothetical protein
VTIVTGICVMTSYQIKWLADALNISPVILAIVGLIIGGFASNWLMALLIDRKFVRKLILGKTWLEGWWVLVTYTDEGTEHKGLLEIRYVGDLRLEAFAYYLDMALDHLTARSYYLTVDEKSRRYINYARVVNDGMPNYDIVAVGELHPDRGHKYPTLYKGERVDLQRNTRQWQGMSKIDNSIVRRYRRRHGDVWRTKLWESQELAPFIVRASRITGKEYFTDQQIFPPVRGKSS